MGKGKYFSFEIEGLRELEKMLDQLPKAMSKTVMRNALKKAGVPVRDAAERNAPIGEKGDLHKSMVISTKLKGRRVITNRTVLVFVGSTSPLAHLVEFGTTQRFHKSGKATGKMGENGFFTRAWDKTKRQALNIATIEIEKELMKAANRLYTRAARGTLGKKSVEFLSK